MKTKALILAAAFAAFFTPTFAAPPLPPDVKPVRIPITALCSAGTPEYMLMFLADTLDESPTHQLKLEEVGVMYVTQSSKPSASVVIYNAGSDITCWFWWTDQNMEETGAVIKPPGAES